MFVLYSKSPAPAERTESRTPSPACQQSEDASKTDEPSEGRTAASATDTGGDGGSVDTNMENGISEEAEGAGQQESQWETTDQTD